MRNKIRNNSLDIGKMLIAVKQQGVSGAHIRLILSRRGNTNCIFSNDLMKASMKNWPGWLESWGLLGSLTVIIQSRKGKLIDRKKSYSKTSLALIFFPELNVNSEFTSRLLQAWKAYLSPDANLATLEGEGLEGELAIGCSLSLLLDLKNISYTWPYWLIEVNLPFNVFVVINLNIFLLRKVSCPLLSPKKSCLVSEYRKWN